jgi:hypothetical protein
MRLNLTYVTDKQEVESPIILTGNLKLLAFHQSAC